MKDREAWCTEVCGMAKTEIQRSDWVKINSLLTRESIWSSYKSDLLEVSQISHALAETSQMTLVWMEGDMSLASLLFRITHFASPNLNVHMGKHKKCLPIMTIFPIKGKKRNRKNGTNRNLKQHGINKFREIYNYNTQMEYIHKQKSRAPQVAQW